MTLDAVRMERARQRITDPLADPIGLSNDAHWLLREVEHLVAENRWLNEQVTYWQRQALPAWVEPRAGRPHDRRAR